MKKEILVKDVTAVLPPSVYDIAKRLKNSGYQVFLVGGAVRDILRKASVHDFDIGTDALPDDLIRLFPRSLEVGAKFGTVVVIASQSGLDVADGLPLSEFQVTTFRTESTYLHGRWPAKVDFTVDIKEDLSRRDFTINAMAINLDELLQAKPESSLDTYVVDPFNGRKDLADGIIRAVGIAKDRMHEDGLRAMRACRFASSLSFQIEESTMDAITGSASTFTQISAERIREEFEKILDSEIPSIGIELMRRTGLLQVCIPELLEGVGIEQNEYHEHDVYTHLVKTCDVSPRNIRLAGLLHDIAKPRTKSGGHFYGHEELGAEMATAILTRLKYPKQVITHTAKLIRLHMFYFEPHWGDAAVRRFLQKVGDDVTLEELFLLRFADAASNAKSGFDPKEVTGLQERIAGIKAQDAALHIKDLAISGKDLLDEGYAQGVFLGNVLEYLLDKVVEEPELNTKGTLLGLAKAYKEREVDARSTTNAS